MNHRRILPLLCACLLLAGCSPLLERTYTTTAPHNSKFWESEATDTLRAQNYQDLVNDLLILIGQHTESATIRLYSDQEEVPVSELLEQATSEVLQETPMGAYAVEYITSSGEKRPTYHEITLQISYRRSAEQVHAVVNATNSQALYSLLTGALANQRPELAVRIGHWADEDPALVEETALHVRENLRLEETPEWEISYYPTRETAGLIEFVFSPEAEGTEQ